MTAQYTAETQRWLDYWSVQVDLTDDLPIYVDGRVKIYYESAKSGNENHIFAEVEKATTGMWDDLKIYLDVSDRKPRYWIDSTHGDHKAKIEYDPDNASYDKTLGDVTHIEWVESPADRAEERDEPEDAYKECPQCEATAQPDAGSCWRCGRGLTYTDPIRPEEMEVPTDD